MMGSVLQETVQWAEQLEQPWLSDLFRRALTTEKLSESDISEVVLMLKAAYDIETLTRIESDLFSFFEKPCTFLLSIILTSADVFYLLC